MRTHSSFDFFLLWLFEQYQRVAINRLGLSIELLSLVTEAVFAIKTQSIEQIVVT